MDESDQPMTASGFYELPSLPYLRLRFILQARQPVLLPAYQGSMLRGAFGHALRRACCPMGPRQACSSCILHRDCPYVEIFENLPEPGQRPPLIGGQPAAPRPFVFEPRSRAQKLQAGDRLEFDLLLFGKAVKLQSFAIVAVERMARDGLGSSRKHFVLEEARSQGADGTWTTGYLHGRQRWHREAEAVLPSRQAVVGEHLVLRIETPLRLQEKGRLIDRFDFRLLASRMLRRCLALAFFYAPAGQCIDWTFENLLEGADEVRLERDLHWFDWQRYSNRQRRKMKLGGLVGKVRLRGNLEPFSQLLRCAALVHVGKGTTFGLGKVALVENSTDGQEVCQ